MKRRRKNKPAVPQVVLLRALPAAQIKAITRHNTLDRRFRPTARYLERWAVGQGSGLVMSPEDADGLPESRATPLPLDESVVADLTILHSPPDFRRMVFMWFRSPKPPEVIAQELGISRAAVYVELKVVLAYFLGRFHEAGLSIPTWETDT